LPFPGKGRIASAACPRGVEHGLVVVAVDEIIVGEPVGFFADPVDSGGGDRGGGCE
jgi:hypothetical protein